MTEIYKRLYEELAKLSNLQSDMGLYVEVHPFWLESSGLVDEYGISQTNLDLLQTMNDNWEIN